MAYQSLKIQEKWEAMAEYTYVMLRHIPKTERFTLGAEIRNSIWLGLRLIITGNMAKKNKMQYLTKLDSELEVLKALIRTAHGLKLIPNKKYEELSKYLVELGKMLGGWMKYCKKLG